MGQLTKKKEVLAFVLFFSLYMLFLWKVTLSNEYIIQKGEFIPEYMYAHYLIEGIVNKEIPYWNPYLNCGEPYLVWQMTPAVYQFKYLLVSYLAKFLGNSFSIYKLFILQNYILYFLIFFTGCYLFYKYILRYSLSALIAAGISLFTSTSYGVTTSSFQNIFVFLPWIMLYLTKLVREDNPKNILFLAFFSGIASITMGAYSVIIGLTMLIYLFSLILFFWPDIRLLERLKDSKATLFLFLLGIVIFTIIISPNIPVYLQYKDAIHRYGRDLNSITVEFFSKYNISRAVTATFYRFTTDYIGIFPVILFLLGLFIGKNKYKVALLVFAFVSIILSMGEESFIFGILYGGLFPFLRKVRYIFQAGEIQQLITAMLFMGMGVDVILELLYEENWEGLSSAKIKRFLYVVFPLFMIGISVLPLCKAFSISKLALYEVISSTIFRGVFILMGIIFWVLLFSHQMRKREAVIFLSLIIFADLLTVNYQQISKTMDKISYKYKLKATPYKFSLYRTKAEDYQFEQGQKADPLVLKFFYTSSGMWSLNSFLYFNFHPDPSIKVKRLPPDKIDFFTGITQPVLYLSSKAITSPDTEDSFNLLSSLSINELKDTAIIQDKVDEDFSHLVAKAKIGSEKTKDVIQPTYQITDIDFSPNELSFNIRTSQDGFLVYNDGYDRYWEAFVDNLPTKVYRTNINFKSIGLKKGEHSVLFRYNPKLFKMLLGISNGTIVVFLLYMLTGYIQRQRKW